MRFLILLLASLLALPAQAALNVFATVPEGGALAREIGGDKVDVFTATGGLQDPHHIQARPSLIARARNADLLVATGAELEIGWLPLLQRESGNPRIQTGQPGLFEAARQVAMGCRRAHPQHTTSGNPHPDRPAQHPRRRRRLTERMAQLASANARANWKAFSERWQARPGKRGRRCAACPSSQHRPSPTW